MLKSNEKLFRIIELLLEKGSAGVTELADDTPYHKSTVYTHLQTLQENGWAFKSDGTYQLSLKFLTISEQIKNQRSVFQHGHEEIDSLANETGELSYLAVPEDDVVTILHYARGEKATLSVTAGATVPITEHSVGKVLLAFQSETDRSEIDEYPSSDVFMDSDADISEALEEARRNGFVVSNERDGSGPSIAEPDQSGPRSESHLTDVQHKTVAAPVLDDDDEPLAVVAVTGLSKRINGEYEERICQQVVRAAAVIERKLDVERSVPASNRD
ncbi:IclR family transcriptional regulator [Haloarcula sp. S1AR25-5A]|uniref:IclR family transcriptional regulator n=1 Tax=Haloarcula terrestris TaxID=2950533 RepID=A0AAE4JJD7_9EURY|nr:IclR family transcriptional regulator [Haloarcula terrestris]MDS0223610.1 IclR family transcriptional regulator [Haloarcula terrestris]